MSALPPFGRLVLAFCASLGLHLALGLWPAEEGRRTDPGVPLLASLAPPPQTGPARVEAPVVPRQRAKSTASQRSTTREGSPARGRIPSTIVLPASGEAGADVEAEKLSARQRRVPRSDALLSPAAPLEPIKPRYPPDALARGIKGHVVLQAIIGVGGRVEEVVVIDDQGGPELAQAAVDAVRGARFTPARDAGHAIRSRLVLRVEFTYE